MGENNIKQLDGSKKKRRITGPFTLGFTCTTITRAFRYGVAGV